MAQPIPITPDTPESKHEIEARRDHAKIPHAKAVLSAYELLQQLHDARVIDVLRGALEAGDTLITKIAMATNTEESINIFRNMVSALKILGSIDPDVLHSLADEFASKHSKETVAPPPRFWTALRMFASADSRRALVGTAAFVQAFGRALAKGKSKR